MKGIKKHLSSAQIIILGFAAVILIGSLLLMLPVSSRMERERFSQMHYLPQPPLYV